MKMRVAVLCVYCLMASLAIAEELGPEQAKAFRGWQIVCLLLL